jgi:hypothetical protein
MNQADTHNFGRKVTKTMIDGREVYLKPRPIANELFLFGQNSPLKDLVYSRLKNPEFIRFWDAIFNLTGSFHNSTESWAPYSGYINGISPLTEKEIDARMAEGDQFILDFSFNFGMILGFTHFFGVTDLHYENLLISKDGIHVIDSEAAFEGIKFLSQTMGIGTTPLTRNFVGITIYWWLTKYKPVEGQTKDSDVALPAAQFERLIKGYAEAMDQLTSLREEILLLVKEFIHQHQDMPFRVILRHTFEYFMFMTEETPPERFPFIAEEFLQMSRGDLPYFFSTPTDLSFFYVGDAAGTPVKVALSNFHPLLVQYYIKSRYNADELFAQERVEMIRSVGLIEIYRELNLDPNLIVKIGDTVVFRKGNMIYCKSGHITYEGEAAASLLMDTSMLSSTIKVSAQTGLE